MNKKVKSPLTSAELGKLWACYESNTMVVCVLHYFLRHVDDKDIRSLLETSVKNAQNYVDSIKGIFQEDDIAVPMGFSPEADVNLTAPRLFLDPFYLQYLKYDAKAGMSVYATALPLMTREDVRSLFTSCIKDTIKLCNAINDILLEKGLLVKPPIIPLPKNVDFIRGKSYFSGFFGKEGPLQALAITHLYDNVQNSAVSKAKEMGFAQCASSKETRQFFEHAVKMANRQLDAFDSLLKENDLPAVLNFDDQVTDSTISPFSDKLMMFHTIESAAIRVRTYGNSLSFSSRHDLALIYGKLMMDVGRLAEEGAKLMIEHEWLEQPPQAANRDQLITQR